jgi:Holliday junction resolvase RusA-like endonuclease
MSFTPDRTAAYEAHVKLHALAARCKTTRWPWQDKAVIFGITIVVHRSAARGDWDNFAKAITDACNGTLWADDRQIRWATVSVNECEKTQERVHVDVCAYGT